jgi:hypothetical protein
METSLIVVDDFMANAGALREAALRMTYPQQEASFPGRNSVERINIAGLDGQISNIVGEPLRPVSPLQSHGKCRITLANDKGLGRVHVDQSHWSGILYLSRPEDCRGGTDFFRHLPTNSDRAPGTNEELARMGYTSFEAMQAEIGAHSTDERKWEHSMQVPMRFNRLVLLRPWLWHTAGPGFGNSIENGRLVYLLFFQSAAR